MAKITLILDTRHANVKGLYPIQFRLSHNSSYTSIGSGVAVKAEHWIGEINRAVKSQCPNAKRINEDIETLYYKFSNALRDLELSSSIRFLSVTEIKRLILSEQRDDKLSSFTSYFKQYADTRLTENSRIACRLTLKTILDYSGSLDFAEVTVRWLKAFDNNLITKGNSINTRGFHFRNIRAVINSAINEDLIGQELYPFRKFKIMSCRKSKEFLTKAQMQLILAYSSPLSTRQVARDLFVLSFYFCGINLIDLYQLVEIKNGRIHFIRQKTASKCDDVKSLAVQPEAMQIIERYRGEKHVLKFIEECSTYETFNNRIQKGIRAIGKELGLDGLTFYWARYTWATFADKLGIPEKEISKALGHVDTSVAGKFYISYDWAKVDRANRTVIDYSAIQKNNM